MHGSGRSTNTASAKARRAARTPARAGYHHGSLRRALLDAALTLIDRDGPEGFTLRGAAREAGVTSGAPYHHFPDKEALIAALAEEGFARLGSAIEAAGAGLAEPAARAHEMAVAYVRFAAAHPTHFRVMMGRDAGRAMKNPALAKAARSAYEVMRDAVVADAESKADAALREELVLGSWSLVHGLAFLVIDGHVRGKEWRQKEPLVRRTLLRYGKRDT
jgi:AcrR family transcriptional regulator